MLKIMLILTLISNLAFAQNAVHMNKGDVAEFEGDLLTLSTAKQLYDDSLEKNSLQKQLDLTNQNLTLLQQDKTLLLDQNSKLIKAAQEEKVTSDVEKGLWFLGGIILTGLAVKAAGSLKP